MVSNERADEAADDPPAMKRLLRDHWVSPHPVPDWVQTDMPESAGRIKVIEKAALIEHNGRDLVTGCELCNERAYRCTVLRPVPGVKVRCARCTNYGKVCSWVSYSSRTRKISQFNNSQSNDQGWQMVENAFRLDDEYEREVEDDAEDDVEAEGGENVNGDETEIEGEVEGGDDGGDYEGVEAENLGVTQPQDFEEVPEYDGQDGDDVYGEEEMHVVLQSYRPRVSNLRAY